MIAGLDTEYVAVNAPYGANPPPTSARPDPRLVYCELMQWSACKLDFHGNEIARFNHYIRPHQLWHIPAWLQTMTGISHKMRENGISFPEALDLFVSFVDDVEDADLWTFNLDYWVIEKNAQAHGIKIQPDQFPFSEFRRFKPVLTEKHGINFADYQKAGYTEVCSGGVADVLGIPLPEIPEATGLAHDSLHDCRSMTHGIHKLEYS